MFRLQSAEPPEPQLPRQSHVAGALLFIPNIKLIYHSRLLMETRLLLPARLPAIILFPHMLQVFPAEASLPILTLVAIPRTDPYPV